MFRRKVIVSQGLVNTVLYLLGSLLQFHRLQLSNNSSRFLPGGFLTLLSVDRVEHLGNQLCFGARNDGKYIAVEVDGTALVLGLRKHLTNRLQHPKAFVAHNEVHAVQAAAF